MSRVKYTIANTDGRAPTVTLEGEEGEQLQQFVKWVRDGMLILTGKTPTVEQDEGQVVPMCAIHHVAMVWQRGRRGFFWSCHQKNADGSFCSYRPLRQ